MPPGADESALSTDDPIGTGTFAPTMVGTMMGYSNIQGALHVGTDMTETSVNFRVYGLKASMAAYPAHVHNLSCAEGGGTHYMLDRSAPAGQPNEIWLDVKLSGDRADGTAQVQHVIRPDARSVVIHEPVMKAKIACADLKLDHATGPFGLMDAGKAANLNVQGWAALLGRRQTIRVWADITGLQASTMYVGHVHNASCSAGAGTHYQIDPMGTAGEINELWLMLETDAMGHATATVAKTGDLRADAKSVVIHDPVTKAKLVCADLQ